MSKNCSACNDLRKSSPEFTQKGVTETVCTSLKNNTGFNPSNDTEDFDDLYDAVDCLVCNMDDELPAYDVCDWKEFMKKLIPNLCNTLKAIVCAIGGIWNFIKDILSKLAKLECIVNNAVSEKKITITQENITLGPGVSYRTEQDDHGETKPAIPKISGNQYCVYLTGGIKLDSTWTSLTGDISDGGRLVYTYKIKKSDFKIKRFWPAPMVEANAGVALIAHVQRFSAGQTAWGYESGIDTHGAEVVPDGYEYLQVRLVSVVGWGNASSNGEVTLCGVMPILPDVETDC